MEGLWGVDTDQSHVSVDQAKPYIFHNKDRDNLVGMGMDIHKMVVMVFHHDRKSFWTIIPISWDGTRYQWADVEREDVVKPENEPNWEDWRSYGFVISWGE